jgi:hypothetical protein
MSQCMCQEFDSTMPLLQQFCFFYFFVKGGDLKKFSQSSFKCNLTSTKSDQCPFNLQKHVCILRKKYFTFLYLNSNQENIKRDHQICKLYMVRISSDISLYPSIVDREASRNLRSLTPRELFLSYENRKDIKFILNF